MPVFHVTFRDLLHAINLRHGTNSFTSLPKEVVLRIFFALKNPSPGLNLRTWVLRASTQPLDHRSRLIITVSKVNHQTNKGDCHELSLLNDQAHSPALVTVFGDGSRIPESRSIHKNWYQRVWGFRHRQSLSSNRFLSITSQVCSGWPPEQHRATSPRLIRSPLDHEGQMSGSRLQPTKAV
jgi:hypothetical protein